jgi:hypothetical protein
MGFTVAAEDEDEDGTVVLSVILSCNRYFIVAFVAIIVEEQWGTLYLAMLLACGVYDLLSRCRRRRGRHHSRPRFIQLEMQKEGLFHSVCLSAHPSRKRRGSTEVTERKHVRLRVVCREWWGSW